MDPGIIDLRRQAKNGGCKASDPGKEIVGSDHPIMLRGDEADASIEQRLNGIQHIQSSRAQILLAGRRDECPLPCALRH
jgi:hypothetical protein